MPTVSSILAPTSMPTASVRLYNLAHYGQSEVLSAMVFAAALAPVVVLAVLSLLRRAADTEACAAGPGGRSVRSPPAGGGADRAADRNTPDPGRQEPRAGEDEPG